jgi:hypothetical protein
MVRMQVQFTPEQAAGLRQRARRRGISISALVREAVDRELSRQLSQNEAWARFRSVVGSGHGGGGNVAADHDEYLDEAFADD